MSGVLLATVPSPVRTVNPPLEQLYLTASLRAAGIQVRLLDLASLYGPRKGLTTQDRLPVLFATKQGLE